ncbi:MAG TPA: HEAT repeat domain-containing protein [Kofleriaceae bacterium]|nr:HEAT repeat domain-containing protein [Kofleriaceae bacterium]
MSFVAACANHARPAVALYEQGDYAGAARAADTGLAAYPGDEDLWQMRVRAALALGDAAGIARTYAAYRGQIAGDDDKALVRELAIATLGQALASPSVVLKLAAIDAVVAAELEPLAEPVAQRMADDDDRVVAAAAIAVLRGDPRAPGQAGEMLHSENAEARRIVVDGLGKKVGALAFADLEAAGADGDPRVRRAAIHWLGQLKDKDAVGLLTMRLHDPDEAVRAAAASALAKIGIGNLAELGVLAARDPALAVRLAGIELLVATHGQAQAALAALADDPDPVVAAEAAIAIDSPAGGPARSPAGGPASGPAHGDRAAKAIDRAASAGEWTVRAGAANLATRALGKPAAIALAKRLSGDPEPRVRLAAARVLAHAGDAADRQAAGAVFLAVMQGAADHPELAIEAAVELATQDDATGLQALETAVGHAERSADRAAAAAGHEAARHITPGLVAALADRSGVVRVAAAAALTMLSRHP